MKILVVIPRYVPDRVAGAELEAKWLSEAFSEEGHEIVILTEESDSRPEITRENGVKVVRRIKNPRTANPQPYYQVLKHWLMEKPDLLHLHHVYPTGLWAYPIARFTSTPVVITSHAEIKGSDSEFDNIRSNPLKDYLCRFASHASNQLVLCSSNLEKEATDMNLAEDQFVTINNCIVQESSRTSKKEYKEVLKKYGLQPESKIVFLVSRLDEKKGIDLLLKAAERIQNDDINIVIAGKGPEKEKLENYIERNDIRNAKLLGFIPDEDKDAFLDNCDLFVFPSYSEGLPLVILEAMREGCPILSSDISGPQDVLNESNARFFEGGNAEDLKEKLVDLIQNSEEREKISKKAQEDIKKLSPEQVGEKYLRLFKRLKDS